MDLGLAGKVFIVTGGTDGLGLASAKELVKEGARVVISSRSNSRLEVARVELEELAPGAVCGIAADNGAKMTGDRLVEAAFGSWGSVDGLLVSVGGPPFGTVLGTTEEDWETSFNSIFLGALRIVRAVVPHLPRGGAIGLVLSSSVKTPLEGLGISNGLRPGLAMAAKDLADELGPSGIRVISLLPGRFETARARSDSRDRSIGVPLGRTGDPAEFGRATAFLLSPAASYVTGTAIAIDGGVTRTI